MFQRKTAESLLYHLRAEHAKAASDADVSEADVTREFYAIPLVAERGDAYKRALETYNESKRVSRHANDPSVTTAKKRLKDLEAELSRSWQQMKPEIQAMLAQGDVDPIRQAASEITVFIAIVDTSPLLVVTDPLIIAAAVDGILLVVRVSVTRRHDAERCQDLLKTLQTPMVGLVINGINPGQREYGYGYGYLYGYGAYGPVARSGNGDDPVNAHPSVHATAAAELPSLELNGTNGHATLSS